MEVDTKIIIDLGSLADWFSGVGAIITAAIALWLATKDNRPKLSISVVKDEFEHIEAKGPYKPYHIIIHNIRVKRVHIRYIGFYYRKGLKLKMLARERSNVEPLIDSIGYDETKVYKREISVMAFKKLTDDKIKHLYLIVEDVNGKKYKIRFKP